MMFNDALKVLNSQTYSMADVLVISDFCFSYPTESTEHKIKEEQINKILDKIEIEIRNEDCNQTFYLNGRNVTKEEVNAILKSYTNETLKFTKEFPLPDVLSSGSLVNLPTKTTLFIN